MNEYHSICGKVHCYLIDNIRYMAALKKRFNLGIIDPPYGLNIVKDGVIGNREGSKTLAGVKPKNYGKKDWDSATPPPRYFDLLYKLTDNQIIFGANHLGNMPSSPGWFVWDKDNTGNYSDCELAYTSFKVPARLYKYRWNGMLQGNMKDKEVRFHPTQKPVALYDWILKTYAKENDTILDTHGGSMSLAISVLKANDYNNMNLEITVLENDPEYFAAAIERIQQHEAQLNIFNLKAKE